MITANDDLDLFANSFDLLKLCGATFVMLSHSFRWFGVEKPFYSLFLTNGSVGVMMFFTITGFLIMPAYERQLKQHKHSLLSFYWNRIVRIYPGIFFSFLVITLIDMLIIGENIFSFSFIKYAMKYCIFARGGGFGEKGLANGVMWTILPDIVYYILTPLIWKFFHSAKTSVWIFLISFFWLFNLYDSYTISLFRKIPIFGRFVDESFFLCFIYEFLIGSFLYFKRSSIINYIRRRRWISIWYLVLFTIISTYYWYNDSIPQNYLMHSPYMTLLVCPLTIFLAFSFGAIHLKYDFSYGLFLCHMIVVGVLLWYGVNGFLGVALTIAITPLLAAVSYFLVERPCRNLKNK